MNCPKCGFMAMLASRNVEGKKIRWHCISLNCGIKFDTPNQGLRAR